MGPSRVTGGLDPRVHLVRRMDCRARRRTSPVGTPLGSAHCTRSTSARTALVAERQKAAEALADLKVERGGVQAPGSDRGH